MSRVWVMRSLAFTLLSAFSLIVVAAHANDIPPAANVLSDAATIPGAISDGKVSPPASPPMLPDFKVKSTVVRELDVVEPPPMSGLPPVTGTIIETVNLVEDPKLPDPPPPPAPPLDSGARIALKDDSARSRCLFLSATVYDHSRTLLRCYTSGNLRNEITAWSNLDFNYFSGFSNFTVKRTDGQVRAYDMMGMGIGNEDTVKRAYLVAKHGGKYKAPEIPQLPDGEPPI